MPKGSASGKYQSAYLAVLAPTGRQQEKTVQSCWETHQHFLWLPKGCPQQLSVKSILASFSKKLIPFRFLLVQLEIRKKSSNLKVDHRRGRDQEESKGIRWGGGVKEGWRKSPGRDWNWEAFGG